MHTISQLYGGDQGGWDIHKTILFPNKHTSIHCMTITIFSQFFIQHNDKHFQTTRTKNAKYIWTKE